MQTLNNLQEFNNPKYISTIADEGNDYTVLSDYWDTEINMVGLDQIIIEVSLAVGYEAQMRFGKNGVYGSPVPLKVGYNVWDDMAKYGFDSIQMRNAEPTFNAQIIGQVFGV